MDGQLQLALRRGEAKALSVSQLVRLVREALELQLDEYWVTGEISNARVAPSNHLYFTLKDSRSAISVVMFRSAHERLRFKVADGMEVVVRGRVNLYEPRGALQFYAEEMEPRGLGALQLAFEQLKQRLAAEGLFAAARKRPLPFLPRAVGVVTALGGAALRDLMRIAFDRYPNLHLIIRPARVQGAGAALEIAAAIEDLNHDGRAEVIVVGRGGGSLEDLWAFNEEPVARAIHASAIPVVSAVGHEIDYTIADFVADARAPTPSAAAQLVVPAKAELKQRLEEIGAALGGAIGGALAARRKYLEQLALRVREPRNTLRQMRLRLDEASTALSAALSLALAARRRHLHQLGGRLRGPSALARELRLAVARLALHLGQTLGAVTQRLDLRLERTGGRLQAGIRRTLELERHRLGALANRLDSLSPLRVLERGYAVVSRARDGGVLSDAAAAELGDELEIRLRRGKLRARTTARET